MTGEANEYFVRSRGRVSGPFGVDALRQRVTRGQIARFDDVSTDRVRWVAAGDLQELFPVLPAAAATPKSAGRPAASPTEPSGRAATNGTRYHYAMNGINVGPVELDVLKAMAQSGALRANDAVWLDGADVASYASQLPALAAFYGRERLPLEERIRQSDTPPGPQSPPAVLPAYLAIAVLLLAATVPPLFVSPDRVAWWWDAGPGETVLIGYTILAALALLVVALAARGLARAITCVCLVGLPTVPILIGGFFTARDASAVWSVAMLTTAMACAMQSGLWHSAKSPARAAAITFGSITCLSALLLVILSIQSLDRVVVWNGGTQAVLLLTLLQAITALAAGVLTIVGGAAATAPHGVRVAALVTNWISTAAAATILVLGIIALVRVNDATAILFSNFAEAPRAVDIHGWLTFLAVRVGVLVAAWIALCGTATLDLLAAVRSATAEME